MELLSFNTKACRKHENCLLRAYTVQHLLIFVTHPSSIYLCGNKYASAVVVVFVVVAAADDDEDDNINNNNNNNENILTRLQR